MKNSVLFLSILFLTATFGFAADGGKIEKRDLTTCKTWEELYKASRLDLPPGLYCAYTKEELLAGVKAMPEETEVDKARKQFVLVRVASEELVDPMSGCLHNFTRSMIWTVMQSPVEKTAPDNIFEIAEQAENCRIKLDDPDAIQAAKNRRAIERWRRGWRY